MVMRDMKKGTETPELTSEYLHYLGSAWMDYVMLDEESQNRCERLMDEFRENWRIVAEAKVKSFIQLLQSSARQPQDHNFVR